MEWTFEFSNQADKFLVKHRISDVSVIEIVKLALQKLDGEVVAVDLERLHEPWKGFFRIRVQKTRIIFSFNAHARRVYVAVVDSRDSAYRRRK